MEWLTWAVAALRAERERIAGLTAEEARAEIRAEIVEQATKDARIAAAREAREIENTARREAERKARNIIVGAVQRLAGEQTSEAVSVSVKLPSEEMKGRIIGKEGRNIRTFEHVTGANLLIDDTPATVTLSCFEPERRETARIALEDLVADGNIHPQRIEHAHRKALRAMEQRMLDAAGDAMADVGVVDLAPELVPVLGKLAFRTSYGQNVLDHLVECAHLAGLMAAELGIDVAICKRAAFLHDIGKALTHEQEGSHALVGAKLLRQHGEDEDVVHAVEAHHNEVEPETVEAFLVQAADAISGGRPGARSDSLEGYMERMQQLEQMAKKHEGVAQAFAVQAGREIRVMVQPDVVDDAGAEALALTIAQEIEEKMAFPGRIRITVVRESRATATAHQKRGN